MAKTIVGIESGTSYAIIAGTKTFTISGLSGKLTKASIRGVLLIRSGVKTALIIANVDDNTAYTLTENAGVYTVDYTGLTAQPALQAGDELIIDYVADSRQTELSDKIDLVQSAVELIGETTIITDTHPVNITTTSGLFFAPFTGKVKSFTPATECYVNETLANVGTNINAGDKVRLIVSSPAVVDFVTQISTTLNAEVTAQKSVTTENTKHAPYVFGYCNRYGLVKFGAVGGLLDDNDEIITLNAKIYKWTNNYVSAKFSIYEDEYDVYFPGAISTSYGLLKVNKITDNLTGLSIGTSATPFCILENGDELVLISNYTTVPVYSISKTNFTTTWTSASYSYLTFGVIANNKLYIGSATNNVYVINLSTGGLITTITTVGVYGALLGSDGYLYVAGTNYVYKIDTTSDGIIGSINTSMTTPYCIEEKSGYLIISSNHANGTCVINLSSFAFSNYIAYRGYRIFVYNNYLFIATYNGIIYSYDITNPSSPTTITSVSTNYAAINCGFLDSVNAKIIVGAESTFGYKIYKIEDLI